MILALSFALSTMETGVLGSEVIVNSEGATVDLISETNEAEESASESVVVEETGEAFEFIEASASDSSDTAYSPFYEEIQNISEDAAEFSEDEAEEDEPEAESNTTKADAGEVTMTEADDEDAVASEKIIVSDIVSDIETKIELETEALTESEKESIFEPEDNGSDEKNTDLSSYKHEQSEGASFSEFEQEITTETSSETRPEAMKPFEDLEDETTTETSEEAVVKNLPEETDESEEKTKDKDSEVLEIVGENIYLATSTVTFGTKAVSLVYGPGTYFTDNGKACTDHGTSGIHSATNEAACNCKCSYNGITLGATQCYGYARYLQQVLFGKNEYTNSGDFKQVQNSNISDTTAAGVKFQFYELGTIIC